MNSTSQNNWHDLAFSFLSQLFFPFSKFTLCSSTVRWLAHLLCCVYIHIHSRVISLKINKIYQSSVKFNYLMNLLLKDNGSELNNAMEMYLSGFSYLMNFYATLYCTSDGNRTCSGILLMKYHKWNFVKGRELFWYLFDRYLNLWILWYINNFPAYIFF